MASDQTVLTDALTTNRLPWGKHRDSGETHRLEHHCADVACCFQALIAEPVLKDRFDRAVGGNGLDDATLARLSVLAYLHDFGKLSAGFQFRAGGQSGAPQRANHIEAAIWACNRPEIIESFGLDKLANWGAEGLQQLLCAVLAHHGRPISPKKLGETGRESSWRPYAGYDPISAGRSFFQRAREWFPEAFEEGPLLPATPALAHLFAGTLAMADQIGSNEELFQFEPNLHPSYIRRARERATTAVHRLGFSRARWIAATGSTDFQDLFEGWSPRSLQTAVADAPLDCPLLILESETGSGKTEAAIWRFARLWKAGLVDGLYFALPTRAAAKQLHERVNLALARLFPEDAGYGTLLAIPGYFQMGASSGWRVGKYDVGWRDDPTDKERLARWSAESARRFLAATAAVGTVDQALLSGLQVKWAHFRGSALVRSLLVVDEVHASDTYMTEVLRGMLRSHLEVGGHALLMSATLGSEARDLLVSAALDRGGVRDTEMGVAKAVEYPVLTLSGTASPPATVPFDSLDYEKAVSMIELPVLKDPARIAEHAVREARQGAKVLVVRNTVKGAQAVFREVLDCGSGDMILRAGGGPAVHHSRFAAEDRGLLDTAVENALGKGRQAGGRIVIGTQTLEQSLDIDADFLITDLCPVDVLLQRIGRLHRHQSNCRPKGFTRAQCVVLVPEGGLGAKGLLAHGLGASRNGGIYRDLRILELTRRLVTRHPLWRIPEMNRMLVEEGTHPDRRRAIEREAGPWQAQSIDVDGRAAAERKIARDHVLDRKAPFSALDFPAADEHVRTRLGDDGPRIRLAEPVTGPFGQRVGTFNLPAHMFRTGAGMPTREEIEEARADPVPGGLILTVGTYRFHYDRAGVRAGS